MDLEWRGAAVDPVDDPTAGPPDPEEWVAVTVPGRPSRFAGADAVAYRTTFEDPRDGDEAHAVLDLDGTFAHARVWCNDELVCTHDAYFDPVQTRLPVAATNELVVECRRPEGRFGGVFETDRVTESAAVPGIWWRATVAGRPDPYLASVDLVPQVTGTGGDPTIAAQATVVSDGPVDDRVTFSVRPAGSGRGGGGTMQRTPVEFDPDNGSKRDDSGSASPGSTTVQDTLTVQNPSLWWPRGLGDQTRYVVRASIGDADASATTGLRSVRRGDDGLLVNGERVPERGFVAVDPTQADVERAASANATLLRGYGSVLSPAAQRACDESGLLVWQDLPLVGPGGFDAERGRALAERLVAGRRHHPSLATLSVHADAAPDPGRGVGSGWIGHLRYRWRAWRTSYDRDPADAVADAVEGVPVVPVVGPPGTEADAHATYPGWRFGSVADLAWLGDRYGADDRVAALGAGALSTGDDGEDAALGEHVDAAPTDDVDDSQAYQADILRRGIEQLRRGGASVVAVDALRDRHAAGLGVLARDGTPKAAYDAVATALEPVLVVLTDPTPGESDVVCCYDRPTAATATVEWDVAGERDQVEVAVDPFERVTVGTVDLESGDHVTTAVAVGETVTANEYEIE